MRGIGLEQKISAVPSNPMNQSITLVHSLDRIRIDTIDKMGISKGRYMKIMLI